MSNPDVLIVGGGLSGLCCARRLNQVGITSLILESSDQAGGRARTDEIDGFRLDRGFQVLLTAYPEAKAVLDYDALQLQSFEPGALVRYRGKFHRFVDPWRRPQYLISTALSPIATFSDKLRVARLKRQVCRGTLDEIYERPEKTTCAKLRDDGFSDRIIEHFFRPFMGGVFLERELRTSSRKFDFVFRMFAQGDAALPAGGMGAMAAQLADNLPAGTVRTNARVTSIRQNIVRLDCGEELRASKIVVACEEPGAARLFGEKLTEKDNTKIAGHGVTCLYFAADKPPVEEPILVLNGEGNGAINNLCVPSQVAAGYAPLGQSLISVTVLGIVELKKEAALQEQVMDQLRDWFGSAVTQWRHLKTYRIDYALPTQPPPGLTPVQKSANKDDDIFVCGDYLDTASIQGAMISGRRAADCVVASI